EIEERTIPGGPKGTISIRIVRAQPVPGNDGSDAKRNETPPVILYFHGGGWVLGDKETHDRLVRELAHGAGATGVFVDYLRSPEHACPTAIEEAYAASQWVAENAAEIGVDPHRIAVAGDSAGGNMAAVTALLAKER